jgi:site-specific recombinase XerC
MGVIKYDRKDGRASRWGVRWTSEGKRHYKFFARRQDRDDYFDGLVKRQRQFGTALLEMGAADAAVWKECLELVGSGSRVLEACKAIAGRKEIVEVAARDAAKTYLKEKSDLGRDANYRRAIGNILRRVAEGMPDNLAAWTPQHAVDLRAELAAHFSAVTVVNHLKATRVFCGWAIRKGLMSVNPFEGIEAPDVLRADPGFLAVEDAAKLMRVSQESFPETVAYFALGLFAGIRSSACAAMEKDAINFGQRGILIRAEHAKNKRRVYLDGYEPNLWTWLDWARQHAPEGFALSKRRWDTLRIKVAADAGVELPHNALRHSFCTYHVALHGDAGKTATLLSHRGNVSVLYEHYKGNASKAEAKKYFSIVF